MRGAFIVSTPNWEVIRDSIDPDVLQVLWQTDHLAEALSYLAHEPPELLVVEAVATLATAELVGQVDQTGLRLVALITSPAGDAVADSLGIGERVRSPDDLTRSAQGLPLRSAGSADPPAKRGEVWAVWGPTGSPGRTTMAIAVSSALTRKGLRVVLVDADPRGGTVAPALGLLDDVPGFIAACRLAKRGELTAEELLRLMTRYPLGPQFLWVLTGLSRMMREGEAQTASVDAVIERLREHSDVVVVDPGSDLVGDHELLDNSPSDHARLGADLLSQSDVVIAVAHASPTGVARLARALPDAKRLAPGRVEVWLNGVDSHRRALRDEGVLAEALWRFAEVSDYRPIHHDAAVRQALMAGVTVHELPGKHAVVSAVDHAVERIVQSRQLTIPSPARPKPLEPGRTPTTQTSQAWWRNLWNRVVALR